jgi:hypothetical protein
MTLSEEYERSKTDENKHAGAVSSDQLRPQPIVSAWEIKKAAGPARPAARSIPIERFLTGDAA